MSKSQQKTEQNRRAGLSDMEFHRKADDLIEKYAEESKDILQRQAKTIACHRKAGVVTREHVEEAKTIIKRSGHEYNSVKALTLFIGSAFFGAFVTSFMTELGGNTVFAIYIVLGFIGIILAFWSLWH